MNVTTTIKSTITGSVQNLFSWCYLLEQDGLLQPYVLRNEQWHKAEQTEQNKLWSSNILLLASDKTHFMYREFPTDMISKADLYEAIQLDIDSWSPWGAQSQFYAWPQINGDTWSVAVWVWELQYDSHLKQQAELQQIKLTHCLPQQAWYALCIKNPANTLLLLNNSAQQTEFIYLNELGLPLISAAIKGDGSHSFNNNHSFKRTLGSHFNKIKQLAYPADKALKLPDWLAEIKQRQPLAQRPALNKLQHARLANGQQFNAQVYRSHALAIFALFVVWFAADMALLNYQDSKVQALLSSAEQQAHQVLDDRNSVVELTAQIQQQNKLKFHQYRVMKVLAGLSEKLPEYAWLINLREDGSSIEIFGKGRDVSRLAPVFEELKAIDHVAYLADIKPVSGTELEVFRLKLTYQKALRWVAQ